MKCTVCGATLSGNGEHYCAAFAAKLLRRLARKRCRTQIFDRKGFHQHRCRKLAVEGSEFCADHGGGR